MKHSTKWPSKLTAAELEPYAREWLSRTRKGKQFRPKVLRPCKYCGTTMGARERRAHEPHCAARTRSK